MFYLIFYFYRIKNSIKSILITTFVFSEQWWCTEYADEIHNVLRHREYDRFGFEYKAPQMQWRMHIIQYMLDVAQKMKLSRTTLHLGEFTIYLFIHSCISK